MITPAKFFFCKFLLYILRPKVYEHLFSQILINIRYETLKSLSVWRFKMVFPYFNMHFLNFDCHIRKISSGYCWGRREGSWRITGNVWICLRTQENLKNWTLGTTVMKAVSEQFLVLKVVIFLCLLALFFWESALLFLSQLVVYAYPSCTRNSCLSGIYNSSF